LWRKCNWELIFTAGNRLWQKAFNFKIEYLFSVSQFLELTIIHLSWKTIIPITFTKNKFCHLTFRIESLKVKIETSLKNWILYKFFDDLGQIYDFANFHFWTIISQIQTSVDESFAEMGGRLLETTGSPSIPNRFK
jgi:hypothetical protein